jgi:DNA-cytosine methyltransferase
MFMNVLGLFDGISCGQQALKECGIKVTKYFSSEVNKNSEKITRKNFPETFELGDITEWKKWELPKIDLIIGGSPCQGFSYAGHGLNFNDPRSKLFFVFADIWKKYKPEYFLLENVKMKKEWQNIITDIMGVSPHIINSKAFVPQNRVRLYWTNIAIQDFPEPTNKKIIDILQPEEDVSDHYYLTERQKSKLQLSKFNWTNNDIIKHKGGPHQQDSIYRYDGIMACLSAATHGAARHLTKTYLPNGKIRRLTEIECERLQGLPDNYTEGIASGNRYEALGNGWTVPVISHIFKNLA